MSTQELIAKMAPWAIRGLDSRIVELEKMIEGPNLDQPMGNGRYRFQWCWEAELGELKRLVADIMVNARMR